MMEEALSVAFLIPNKTPIYTYLMGLHLSLPMGYIGSALYFCMAMDTVAYLAN